MITISFLIVVPLVSFNCILYVFEKAFDFQRNRTLLRLKFRRTNLLDKIYNVYVLYKAVCLNILPLFITLICTIYLTIHLKISAKWRLGNSHRPGKGNENSFNIDDEGARRKYVKDMRVVKTVLSIAVALMLLGTLSLISLFVELIWSDFRPIGALSRSYRFTSRLSFLLLEINSSVNFFIYYKMGTKFRQAVKEMLCIHSKDLVKK